VVRWHVADHIAADEEVSFGELARRCGVPESDFTRILRQAMSKHIFKEEKRGYVRHTAASKLYISPTKLQDYILIALDDVWQSATHTLDAMEKWGFSNEASHTVSST